MELKIIFEPDPMKSPIFSGVIFLIFILLRALFESNRPHSLFKLSGDNLLDNSFAFLSCFTSKKLPIYSTLFGVPTNLSHLIIIFGLLNIILAICPDFLKIKPESQNNIPAERIGVFRTV